MAKQKGHRANKSNDSFGTINNESLYRGNYRDEVYTEDDETQVEAMDPSDEATPEQETSFAPPREESDTDYKKRYDDLKKHYDSKLDEWKQERTELSQAQQAGKDSGLATSELPKTPEELEEFRAKYPDVYAIVETVSTIQADSRLKALKEEVATLKGREQQSEVKLAYRELLAAHPDFKDIKTGEKFLSWLDKQPDSISNGIYKNNTDARWAIRVVDLYKADTGVSTKGRNSKDADSAMAVGRPTAKDVVGDAQSDKKVWKASEIGKMKPWQFEKLEGELDTARSEGRINYNA